MRLSAFAVAIPALSMAQYAAPAGNAAVGTAPPSTTTQTSTTLLVKTIFLSRVSPTTMAQHNSTTAYLPVVANATQAVVTNTASNGLPTAAATLPASQVISAAGSLDAKPFALSGLAALLAFAFL
ncbi:hypothetical protein L249_0843 [Ophiocordyceps polyrhachis-furcata BCC 54312]|uniref:Uncharacterized protein n=1 Tax=Ophiocordyceps polyrhachis-furcata BCC 54312 TaxID=1330021 RepID=A0A367LCN8_9HYPO|nr:hypothetical protein L249_0843 [Ophiocordyceps polyrhachis-furcata BCC 54312]